VFNTNSYIIEETRFDPYLMFSGDTGPLKWEAGLRYETTDTTIGGIDNDFAILLPSASLRYRLSDSDRLTLSVARTVRRPGAGGQASTPAQHSAFGSQGHATGGCLRLVGRRHDGRGASRGLAMGHVRCPEGEPSPSRYCQHTQTSPRAA
jgi:hypothetical protein